MRKGPSFFSTVRSAMVDAVVRLPLLILFTVVLPVIGAEPPTANRPLVQERIIFNWHNFLSGCSAWNLDDWQRWTSQAHGMGYNAIMVHAYGNNPMGAFTFDGVERPVGYLTTSAKGRDWFTMHVNDVRRLVGGAVFDGPVFGSPAAMVPDAQRVESARGLMRQVFTHAAQLGMGIYFAVDVDTAESNPQELILRLPESARFQNERGLWLANPDDPAGYAYYRSAVASYFKAYPQITKLVVWSRRDPTAWVGIDRSMPASWREGYEAELAKDPTAKELWHGKSLFALSKVVRAYARALTDCGADHAQVAFGSWGFQFLPGADCFMPTGIPLIGIDYDVLYDKPQLATADGCAVLAKVGEHRPVIPVIWAQHDDGHYFGNSYTPFSAFGSKLVDAKASGFGVIHWMTRPFDLFMYSHIRQVFSATRDESLQATCEMYARDILREPELGSYLHRWITEAPRFGRETTDAFIEWPLTGKDAAIAACQERIRLLEGAAGSHAAYFRGLERFIIAFYEAQTAYQDTVAAWKKGDMAAARAVIAACHPEEAIRTYVQFASGGGMTPGEKGLLYSLNTRWLVYFTRMRQILGLDPIRINFGPTSHEKLAQGPGRFTYFHDAAGQVWQTFGTEETKVAVVSAPSVDQEIGRSGLVSETPFRVDVRPFAHAAELPRGDYRLRLLCADPDSTAAGQRVFTVAVVATARGPEEWTFRPVKAAFLRLNLRGTDQGDWNSLYEVDLPTLVRGAPDSVSVSESAAGCPAKHLIDRNPRSRWAANGKNHWAQFKLDPQQETGSIRLTWFEAETRTPSFDMVVSQDGTTWTPVADAVRRELRPDIEFTVDIFQKAGQANRLTEWEVPVHLADPGFIQIFVTPVRGKAVLSGLVLTPKGP